MNSDEFILLLRQRGEELYRDMPWRKDTRPYYVLVSELMLQQTQVSRVIPKFEDFIAKFPDETTLASASLADVLKMWQGLGYNRRAKFLHEAAKMVVNDFAGTFPNTQVDMQKLPGVGKNTAGAILAYSFNKPSIFIETNIRTVYIHHFFNDRFDVDDREIALVLEETFDQNNPRQFYWALMDYGTWLKSNGVRNINSSKHYKKQSALKGSIREVRGQIIRELTSGSMNLGNLQNRLNADARFEQALTSLVSDGLVSRSANVLHLTK